MVTGTETIAYGITKTAITTLVKPTITAGLSGLKSLTHVVVDIFTDRFAEYVSQQAQRHSCLSTIVFGHQKTLHDLYIPLTVVPVDESQPGKDDDSILIDRFSPKFIPIHNRILITDTAGMGKSTLSKFLFLQCLKSCYAIPVFIELRHLSSITDIVSLLHRQLNPSIAADDEQKFTKRQIERILKKGGLIFFFDGYDEIPFKDRETVTKDIKELIEKFSNNSFVITSRPESGLAAFPAFKRFNIRPLQKEESFALIRKYDQGGGRSEQLIEKLNGRDFRAVQDFLKNPLLTSLLFRSFEYKQSVPLKKHIFYRQVFDALFDWHDSSKDGYNTREKKSRLDIDEFHRVLRVIGFVSVMTGEVEGSTDTVLGWIRKARTICNPTTMFPESAFLDDLVRAVPVFVKDGDFYRWSHKSLAEYFAAQYICTEGKAQQPQILTSFLTSGLTGRFLNVLDQIYDVDNAAFRANLILPLAKEFSKFADKSYKGINPGVTAEEIRLRKSVSFGHTMVVFNPSGPSTLGATTLLQVLKSAKPSLPDVENRELNLYVISALAKSPQFFVDVPEPFATILDILESKKDALILNRGKLEPRTKADVRLKNLKAPILIDDDPEAEFNQPALFDPYTKFMAGIFPVIDYDKILAFEKSFDDAAQLERLTDELLKPMLGR